jgi:voltage-gated potassium channel Kch
MEEKKSTADRLRYWLDNLYSRGTASVVLTLGLFSLLMALVCTLILILFGLAPGAEEPYAPIEALWVGMLTTLGNISLGGRESAWGYRLLMLVMTFGSLFVASFFISSLTNGMVSRVSELKRGRSKIVEKDHTVILGWTEQVFTVVSELAVAHANQSHSCIAILGDVEKSAMEDQIEQKVRDLKKTRVVCRTGDPMEMSDLDIVSLNTAKNIIVLQPQSEFPDADVIKTILAIMNHPRRRSAPYRIVACIKNPRNIDIATVAGKQEVEWINTSDIVSRVIAQTSLQPGLSAVYDNLFNFEGQEIYFQPVTDLNCMDFGEALLACQNVALLGIISLDGQVILNPALDRPIRKGEQLIFIASDDDEVIVKYPDQGIIQPEMISSDQSFIYPPIKMLILGWNWRGTRIVQELDQYVPSGSEVTVVADHDKVGENLERQCRMLDNLKVCFTLGDTDDRQILEGALFNEFDHIIILGYSDNLTAQRVDAKTLVSLLHLRDIKERDHLDFTVVTEMMDIRNYQLATMARADDYVVSDRLISLMQAQVAENRERNKVFAELLDSQSDEIYLKPANVYVQLGTPVNFYTVIEAAKLRSELSFGYRLAAKASDPKFNYGVVINPVKSEPVTFSADDRIIVLAKQYTDGLAVEASELALPLEKHQ